MTGDLSPGVGRIARMFDAMFAGLGEAALLAAIEQSAREEAQAGARRLAAIAELVYTTVDEDAQEVVYIDHNHLHMVGTCDPNMAAVTPTE